MERLSDTLANYPFRQRPPQDQPGAAKQPLDRMLDKPEEPERGRAEENPPRRSAPHGRRQQGEQVCPICHGAGYLRQDLPVNNPNFGKLVACKCKEKELKEKHRLKLDKLSGLDSHAHQTFQTFIHNQSVPGVQEAFKVAQEYVANLDNRLVPWLVLSGPVGCGKTHLAAAIANVYVERDKLVIFSTVPELLDELRTTFAPSNELPYHELFDDIRISDLLVLDDLGVEHSTPWASDKLFQILNYRYEYRLPTVITTNSDPLKGDKSLDVRIRSRMEDKGLVKWCNMTGARDYRPRNVPPRELHR